MKNGKKIIIIIIIKIASSCHSEDATEFDPVSFLCYVYWVPSLPSSGVDCSFFVSVHAVPLPPRNETCSHRHRDSCIHASARHKSEVCRVLLGRRSLKKINWPTPCFFLFKPGMVPRRQSPACWKG